MRMIIMTVIGKRFGDAGLKDVLVESGVVGASSVHSVISGKHSNHALQCHKAMFEALFRMVLRSFETFLAKKDDTLTILSSVPEILDLSRQTKFAPEAFTALKQKAQLKILFEAFNDFTASCKIPMAKFWLSYIDVVSMLMKFIRSTKEGNWCLHLESIRLMLLHMLAYDRVNYSRFSTYCLLV